MELKSGIYESLIYAALKRKLEALSDKYVFTDSIDSGEAPKLLTNYIAKIINSITEYVEKNIGDFHSARIEKLTSK